MTRPGSLDHVPRRGVAMAKELRRMGLEVVPRAEGDETMSANDMRALTGVAADMKKLGARARQAADKLRAEVDDANVMVDAAENMADGLGAVNRELREMFGTGSNFPPKGAEEGTE